MKTNPGMQIIDVKRGSIIFVVRTKTNVTAAGNKFSLEIANFILTVLDCTEQKLVRDVDVTATHIGNEEGNGLVSIDIYIFIKTINGQLGQKV